MGARASNAGRRFLGSVSAKVVAEAGCSVTVVRRREAMEETSLAPADKGAQ
jgi:nucleotide-binding universal stress UspA family protein